MKKLISALLITTMLLTLTACNNEITIPENLADFEPIPVPEGGWTSETAASVFYINGERIPYPFIVDSLGDSYYLSEKDARIPVEAEGGGIFGSDLYYNKTPLFVVSYRIDKGIWLDFEDLPPLEADSIHTISSVKNNKVDKKLASMIFFNGITLGATKDEVREIFGEPDRDMVSIMWTYFDSGNEHFPCINFHFNENDELFFIELDFWDEKDFEAARINDEMWKEEARQSTNRLSLMTEKIELPCTPGDLSRLGDVSVDTDRLLFNEENHTAEGTVYSGRIPAGKITLADCSKGETDISSKRILTLQLDVDYSRELDFGCATLEHWSTPKDAVKYLGEPEIAGVYRYPMYNVENAFVEFGFDETLKTLTFTFDS